jgi:predicted metal-binding protein
MWYILNQKDIVLDNRANNGFWCTLPYPNHKSGCPNYGKKKTCPPFTQSFQNIIQGPYFLVIQEFDIQAHSKKMRLKHPHWSEKQCRNLLYWQKGLNKKLKDKSYELANKMGDDFIVLEIPEANGVDVFKTCQNMNIELQRYPQDMIRKVMIVGKKYLPKNTLPLVSK